MYTTDNAPIKLTAASAQSNSREPQTYFHALGTAIARKWESANWDSNRFPDIAATSLARSVPHQSIAWADIVQWLHSTSDLPQQGDLDNPFGEPPLHVYVHPRFYIQALFWINSSIAIHQHGFCGAFTLLSGASLESLYRFSPTRRVNEHLLLGELERTHCHVLQPGTVRQIVAGNSFIHAVSHIEVPCVTIIVRTSHNQEAGPQYR
ncbi:MAG: hypothetical protein MJE77_09730 [Proteobacteria bacterium]|nr:hypothetical protein [Pseudomonadota bacterium]